MTMRSGFRNDVCGSVATRNSGTLANRSDGNRSASRSDVPGGTVDFIATIVAGRAWAAMFSTAAQTSVRS